MTGGGLVGPGDVTVRGVASLESAAGGQVAFLRDLRHKSQAEESCASVLVTPVELECFSGTMIVCDDAEMAMAAVLDAFAAAMPGLPAGVGTRASVAPGAAVGADVTIGDFATVGPGTVIGDGAVIHPNVYVGRDCRIGPRTVIYANSSLHDGVQIGADCVIGYNCAVGGHGFGYIQRDGGHVSLAHLGAVRIGDKVELGALTTVDRGMLEDTVIGDGCKIDDHCHIAHNCRLGPDCLLAAGCMLGGSVTLGRGIVVAADCVFKDHISIGDGVMMAAGSAAHKDVPGGQVLWGYPARPIALQRRIFAALGKLPEMVRRVRELEGKLKALRTRPEAPAEGGVHGGSAGRERSVPETQG